MEHAEAKTEDRGETSGAAGDQAVAMAAHPWIIAISVMFGTFMVVLDSTVVNVALPHVAGNLSASIEETTWVLTSYLASNAIILPISGWLANQIGRRRLLLISIAGFTAASVMCGLATSLTILILWRVVQGMTGGVMQPLSQAIMLEAFAPRDRGKAMAFFGLGIVVAPVLGPLLGGWLTDNWTWRWVFYINLPVGAVAYLMVRANVFDPAYIRRRAGVDYWGIGLLSIGVVTLQIALDQGQREDWLASNLITTLLVLAAIGLGGFIAHALTTRHPVVNLRLFKEPTYATGVALITVMGFALYASLVLMPVLLQTLMGYSALQAGFLMAPRGLGTLVMMPIVGVLIEKTDPRRIVALGFLLSGLTMYWLALMDLNAGFWDFFWPQFFQGAGLGMLFVPLTTISVDRIRAEWMGEATSLFNLMRNIGGSVGIATIQTMLARYRQVEGSVLVEHVDPYSPAAQLMLQNLRAAFMARGADAATAAERAYAAVYGMVQQQAAMLSFIGGFKLLALVFLAIVPFVYIMKKPRHHSGPAMVAGE